MRTSGCAGLGRMAGNIVGCMCSDQPGRALCLADAVVWQRACFLAALAAAALCDAECGCSLLSALGMMQLPIFLVLHLPLLLPLLLQERPYPRRPADMPTFPTADTAAGSTQRRQPAALHAAAVQQHMAEVVDAAYAAAGLPRPRRGSDGDLHNAAVAAGCGTQHADADELPATLYQRYDTVREGMEPPAAKRPRPSGGF